MSVRGLLFVLCCSVLLVSRNFVTAADPVDSSSSQHLRRQRRLVLQVEDRDPLHAATTTNEVQAEKTAEAVQISVSASRSQFLANLWTKANPEAQRFLFGADSKAQQHLNHRFMQDMSMSM